MHNKSDLFEIEKIVGKKVERNAIYFLVKWKGYPNKNNTWEPIENFMDFEFLLDKVEEFDHNIRRIADRHLNVIEYRDKMSIEEESDEEKDPNGKVRKFIKKSKKIKKNKSKTKKKVKSKVKSNEQSETRYRQIQKRPQRIVDENEDDEYVPEFESEEDLKSVSSKKNKSNMRRGNTAKLIEKDFDRIEKMYTRSNNKKRSFGKSKKVKKYKFDLRNGKAEIERLIGSIEKGDCGNDIQIIRKKPHFWNGNDMYF